MRHMYANHDVSIQWLIRQVTVNEKHKMKPPFGLLLP